ncbi:Arc family DNA-binding protein [Agrobacterium vitis]
MAQTEDKLIIRLPDGLRATIKKAAAENERTMNAEVIYHLKRAYGAENEKSGNKAS